MGRRRIETARTTNDANYRTAPNRAVRHFAHFAPFGIPRISRRSAFRALRHSAPFGIPRSSAFGAVW